MIMNDSSSKKINTNSRVLKEGRKPTILTGETKKRNAMSFESNEGLNKDLEREIERTIAISKN